MCFERAERKQLVPQNITSYMNTWSARRVILEPAASATTLNFSGFSATISNVCRTTICMSETVEGLKCNLLVSVHSLQSFSWKRHVFSSLMTKILIVDSRKEICLAPVDLKSTYLSSDGTSGSNNGDGLLAFPFLISWLCYSSSRPSWRRRLWWTVNSFMNYGSALLQGWRT